MPIYDEKQGFKYTYLSPDDLVYVPTKDEIENNIKPEWNNKINISNRIYRFISASGSDCYFLRADIASLILPYDSKTKLGEFESQNKSSKTMTEDKIVIKQYCHKLKVDRLGNISI